MRKVLRAFCLCSVMIAVSCLNGCDESAPAESAEHGKSHGRGYYLRYGVCQPEVVQPESGEQPAERDEQEHGTNHGES